MDTAKKCFIAPQPRMTFYPGTSHARLFYDRPSKPPENCTQTLAKKGRMVIMHTTTATLAPGADITGPKSFYVVHLTLRGLKSTVGPELPSYTTDAVITYVDKWMWDITLYLLELTVTVREPAQSQLLAVGNSYHTSLTRLSPKEMTDEVLSNIFGPTTAPVKVRPAKDDFKPRGSNFGK